MFGYLGATASTVGPKQQKCLAAGGSWEGPTGKKKCVMPGGAVPTGATGGALPKAGSTVTGPIPAQYVGTEKKGAAGPKQAACTAQGGYWIGPEGKRWCQMVPGTVPALPVPMDTGLVDTGTVPPVTQPVTGMPQYGDTWTTPDMSVQPGLQTEVTGAPGGVVYERPAGMFSGRNLLILGGVAVGAFFLLRSRGLRVRAKWALRKARR